MKAVQMVCSQCGAQLVIQRREDHSVAFCPYCGNDVRLLVESDRVRIAQMREETARSALNLSYIRYQDAADRERRLFWIRTAIICVTAVAAMVLLVIFLNP